MELVIGDVIDHLNRLMFVNRLEKEGPVAGCGEEQRSNPGGDDRGGKEVGKFAAVRGGKKSSKLIIAIEDEKTQNQHCTDLGTHP